MKIAVIFIFVLLIASISGCLHQKSKFNINEEQAFDLQVKLEQQRLEYEYQQQKQGDWVVENLSGYFCNLTVLSYSVPSVERNESIRQNFTRYIYWLNILKICYPESDAIAWYDFLPDCLKQEGLI